MIILGDTLIPFEDIFFIDSIEDIKNTKANSALIFVYDEKILKYCFENSLNFAVLVNSIKEAVYSNSLGAKYIISSKDLAKEIQKIAENYMYDSKILAIITSNDEFDEIIEAQIDGVIYKELMNK